MDLHVIDPNNEEIFWNHTTSALGGKFVFDMEKTPNGVEIVTFNKDNPGQTLPGTYKIQVVNHACNNINPCNTPIGFSVQVLKSSFNENSPYKSPKIRSNIWKFYYGKTKGFPDPKKKFNVATITLE